MLQWIVRESSVVLQAFLLADGRNVDVVAVARGPDRLAAIEHNKESAIHALPLAPLTAAVCCPAEVRQIAEELFAAEAEYLPNLR